MYTIRELCKASHKLFGVSGALVETALKATGRKKFTLGEAQDLVAATKKREVKK